MAGVQTNHPCLAVRYAGTRFRSDDPRLLEERADLVALELGEDLSAKDPWSGNPELAFITHRAGRLAAVDVGELDVGHLGTEPYQP